MPSAKKNYGFSNKLAMSVTHIKKSNGPEHTPEAPQCRSPLKLFLTLLWPLNGRRCRMLGTYSRCPRPLASHDSRELQPRPSPPTAFLLWLIRFMAVMGLGSILSSPCCARPLRSPPSLLLGMIFSRLLSPNFLILSLGACSRAVLNFGNPPLATLALLMTASSGSMAFIPPLIISILSADAKDLFLCRE